MWFSGSCSSCNVNQKTIYLEKRVRYTSSHSLDAQGGGALPVCHSCQVIIGGSEAKSAISVLRSQRPFLSATPHSTLYIFFLLVSGKCRTTEKYLPIVRESNTVKYIKSIPVRRPRSAAAASGSCRPRPPTTSERISRRGRPQPGTRSAARTRRRSRAPRP